MEKFHTGLSLDAFQSHLLTRAGGSRSSSGAQQVAIYVEKYLYYLDREKVDEMLLLDLALKYAIHFVRLMVSTFTSAQSSHYLHLIS